MRTLVLGDVHGGFRALKQVLERSKFDYDKDRLICLGDVADGWPEIVECFEELFKIKNLVYIRGNHDQWLKDWLKYGKKPDVWTYQGGKNTQLSYLKDLEKFPELSKRHLEFLKKTPCYFIDEEKRCYVHGGFTMRNGAEKETKRYLMWDRDLWDKRYIINRIEGYKEVYIGHTSIYRFSHFPLWHFNKCFMDTGGGWEGVLSILDVDTKEFWQSDKVLDLYPESRGRN